VSTIHERQRASEKIISRGGELRLGVISDDVRIGTFERWDSLAHLRLVLAIEQKIGRQLDPDEAVRIESLTDVAALIAR
jgi:acyl carrier protein